MLASYLLFYGFWRFCSERLRDRHPSVVDIFIESLTEEELLQIRRVVDVDSVLPLIRLAILPRLAPLALLGGLELLAVLEFAEDMLCFTEEVVADRLRNRARREEAHDLHRADITQRLALVVHLKSEANALFGDLRAELRLFRRGIHLHGRGARAEIPLLLLLRDPGPLACRLLCIRLCNLFALELALALLWRRGGSRRSRGRGRSTSHRASHDHLERGLEERWKSES